MPRPSPRLCLLHPLPRLAVAPRASLHHQLGLARRRVDHLHTRSRRPVQVSPRTHRQCASEPELHSPDPLPPGAASPAPSLRVRDRDRRLVHELVHCAVVLAEPADRHDPDAPEPLDPGAEWRWLDVRVLCAVDPVHRLPRSTCPAPPRAHVAPPRSAPVCPSPARSAWGWCRSSCPRAGPPCRISPCPCAPRLPCPASPSPSSPPHSRTPRSTAPLPFSLPASRLLVPLRRCCV